MIVTIHQPEHLPWLGFFDKAAQADTFVLLDNVQFRKNYFQNRNKIRTSTGWEWITLPVRQPVTIPINQIRIDNASSHKAKWRHLIEEHYRSAPHFSAYFPRLTSLMEQAGDSLAKLNMDLIRYLFETLEIKAKLLVASELGLPVELGGTRVNLSICQNLGAKTYISGISGKDYLNEQEFQQSGIEVRYQEFHHPIYSQMHEPFLPCMSVIDLLFTHGKESINILRGVGVPRLDTVFQ